jgi:two-component system nitrogen regulation response regulator NtrX
VVAATNKDLLKEIDEGRFREDLYHRLSVILIHVPSLNERTEDIPLLAERFVKEICEDHGMTRKTITPKAIAELQEMRWSGNIRELRNVLERLVILSPAKITEEHVQLYASPGATRQRQKDLFDRYTKFQDFKEYMEREFIAYRLQQNGCNVSKTAEELDIQRSHLYNKIEKFGLKRVG